MPKPTNLVDPNATKLKNKLFVYQFITFIGGGSLAFILFMNTLMGTAHFVRDTNQTAVYVKELREQVRQLDLDWDRADRKLTDLEISISLTDSVNKNQDNRIREVKDATRELQSKITDQGFRVSGLEGAASVSDPQGIEQRVEMLEFWKRIENSFTIKLDNRVRVLEKAK